MFKKPPSVVLCCVVLAYRKVIRSAACPIANATPKIMGSGYLSAATCTELNITSFLSDKIPKDNLKVTQTAYTKENWIDR